MSDVAASNQTVEPSAVKRGRRWPFLVALMLAGWATINYFDQQRGHRQTIQNILDKHSELNVFKVASVRFPFYEALPLSNYLTELGLVPSEYGSFFSIEFKDGRTLRESCQFETYDYTVRKASMEKRFFQISGPNVVKLNSCT